jgi:tetratricopeptide (TPR) repeat protein
MGYTSMMLRRKPVLHTLAGLAALAFATGQAVAQGAPEDPIRAKCDQAAAQLATSNFNAAIAALEPVLKDPALAASDQKDRAFYYAGCAALGLGNDLLGGRWLSHLAPFERPLYAAHAHYLLGRIHHRAGELTEAAAHYEAVPAAYDKQVAAARRSLPAAKDPAEKASLEATLKGPPPDFIGESIFHLGVLLYEQKSFPEALQKFGLFLQKEKRPAWADEARLRAGMCQVRLGQNAEALKTLQPLQDHPTLARMARWWMARAILATAGAKPGDAAEHLKKAAASPEGESGPGQHEILLALGEALERAGRPVEAVDVYKQVPGEEGLARLAGAHAAAKQYREADAVAAQFEKQFPTSPLTGDVLLRRADVAFAEAQAAGKPELFAEAIKGYERVLTGASGAAVSAAHYRMAAAQYRLGRFAAAAANLRQIPETERTGELAGAFYLHAECLLRGALPIEEAADGIAASKLLQDLQEAAGQLQKFVGQAGPQAPEAILKLGQTLKQLATLLVEPPERAAVANSARELYEGFRAQFPTHPLRPVAEYERANCYVLAGDPATAIQKLERFRAEPMASAPVAPLALLRQAQLYRLAGQAPQAVAILAECRARHEPALLKDPARASWVPLLRYHHALALRDAKQGAEAIKILESIVKDFASGEWAEPSGRLLKEVKP